MTWLDLYIMVMATMAITELVRHDHRFADLRSKGQILNTLWGQVINCGWCFSHWAAIWVVCVMVGPKVVLQWLGYPVWPGIPTYMLAAILAVVRTANIVNDLTHWYNRTPDRPNSEEPFNVRKQRHVQPNYTRASSDPGPTGSGRAADVLREGHD